MFNLPQMIRDAADAVECKFYNGYSGRGMYGDKCIGVTGTLQEAMSVIGEVVKDMNSTLVANAGADSGTLHDLENKIHSAIDELMAFSQDSLGLDQIIYWEELAALEEDDAE